jgi:hypothetical protein
MHACAARVASARGRSRRTEAALAAQLPRDMRSSSSTAASAASESVNPPQRRRNS